jgi:lambda family phage portal protein
MAKLFDRALRSMGLMRVKASTDPGGFRGASQGRLYADWAFAAISADQKIRGSLRAMRERCRQLAGNNDYAVRFLNKSKENVIGSNGIALQMALDERIPNAVTLNEQIEAAWDRWCRNCTVDGRMSFIDALQLATVSKLQDGEVFLRKVKGYPDNPFRFALQFIDPDSVDVQWNQLRRVTADGKVENEIRMSVEINDWARPIAYWMFKGHPAEYPSLSRIRIDASEIVHDFVFKLVHQTRGIPWMHTAMTRMHMLGNYEEAEVVAARLAACKMGYYVSKTGEEYQGEKNKKTGAIEPVVEPGSWEELPEGVEPKVIDWQHPNAAFPEFVRAMLRGAAAGMNVSYSSLSGDLREVNFSSLRQGVLDEREGWRVLQTSAVQHLCQPVFADWLAMAVLTGQVTLPQGMPLAVVLEAATWTPRGWDWVDPVKDVVADMHARGACMTTLQDIAAKRGKDWREVAEQIAKENEYLRGLGIDPNFIPNGSAQNASPDTNENGNNSPQPAGASITRARL